MRATIHTYIRHAVATISLAATLAACSLSDTNQVETRAKQFASNYFNLRYMQATNLCTSESRKWISYRASNITQADLDVLNAQPDSATCEVVASCVADDSLATVTMEVSHFLRCDTIGRPGHMCDKEEIELSLKKVGKQWLIDISSPL